MTALQWQVLDADAWRDMKAANEIIEQDGRGVKVLRCGNGEFVKLFRIKRHFTLARIFNPALEFCNNAEALRERGIDTVMPVALYRIPHLQRWAVRYRPLAGDTVRSLLQQSDFSQERIVELAQFIAVLHHKGIYFRSLHPGNVVLRSDGKFGLIDILDCHFRFGNRPLNCWQRERNFRHFFRYDDGKMIEKALRDAYRAKH